VSEILDLHALANALTELVRRDPTVRRDLARALELSSDDNSRPGLVTVAAYAAQHSLGKSTVRRACKEGRLAHEKIGRLVRIPADAVIANRRPDAVMARAERRLGLSVPRKVPR
jgi:excisionase family DNA binding protein